MLGTRARTRMRLENFQGSCKYRTGCRMTRAIGFLILWLSLAGGLAQSDTSPDAEESYSDWGLRHIRGSFESVNSYFDSFLELLWNAESQEPEGST